MDTVDTLVIEDSPEFAHLITSVLRNAGHRVRVATTVADAMHAISALPPDLVVLDLSLPDGDGLDLCPVIRERTSATVLMLTARDDEVDQLLGFRLGADDYMSKPFSPRVLAARVEALLRRPRTVAGDDAARAVGDIVIHPAARELSIDGVPVELTRIEFDLLDTMIDAPKVVFSRLQLLERVWGPGWVGDDHVVDVHIANLRKKIDAYGRRSRSRIRTVRGVGYSMAG